MMPDLGKYAVTVLMAYGFTVILLGGLILVSVLRSASLRRTLERAEADFRKRRNEGA